MNLRNAAAYVLCFTGVAAGLWLVLSPGRTLPGATPGRDVAHPAAGVPVVLEPGAGPAGGGRVQAGYLGSGKPQVKLEREPTAPAARPRDGEVESREHLEAEKRAAALREVLDRLGGEPVYVEGIDGPSRRDAKR